MLLTTSLLMGDPFLAPLKSLDKMIRIMYTYVNYCTESTFLGQHMAQTATCF